MFTDRILGVHGMHVHNHVHNLCGPSVFIIV